MPSLIWTLCTSLPLMNFYVIWVLQDLWPSPSIRLRKAFIFCNCSLCCKKAAQRVLASCTSLLYIPSLPGKSGYWVITGQVSPSRVMCTSFDETDSWRPRLWSANWSVTWIGMLSQSQTCVTSHLSLLSQERLVSIQEELFDYDLVISTLLVFLLTIFGCFQDDCCIISSVIPSETDLSEADKLLNEQLSDCTKKSAKGSAPRKLSLRRGSGGEFTPLHDRGPCDMLWEPFVIDPVRGITKKAWWTW